MTAQPTIPTGASRDAYMEFLASKRITVKWAGFPCSPDAMTQVLFGHQKLIASWGLGLGRAAIFADTGLGKTPIEIEIAWRVYCETGRDVLILAPFGVAFVQMPEFAALMSIPVNPCMSQADVRPGINVTNYDRLHLFDMTHFVCVILDESSILKNFEGKTRSELIRLCRGVPFLYCFTATPAPNDISEIGNHAEFLGVMTRAEMLAAFFVHDDKGWRLKGWSANAFYEWLASWSIWMTLPSDLGFSDDGYVLPELLLHPVYVETTYAPPGALMAVGLKGVSDRARVRTATIDDRVAAGVATIFREPNEPWVAWTGLNPEADRMTAAINGAVNVHGSMAPEDKADSLRRFAHGEFKVLVTKPKIGGYGMNWQHCARTVFVGLSDSYELYYQMLRRFYRFGQKRGVHAYIVLSEVESAIYENVLRKENEAKEVRREMVNRMAPFRSGWTAARNPAPSPGIHDEEEAFEPRQPVVLPAWLKGECKNASCA